MSERFLLDTIRPELFRGLFTLNRSVKESGLDPTIIGLINVRVSQINGCGYCIDMHTKEARAAGETDQRMHLLNAWREAPLYTDRERAALALAEAVTDIGDGHVPDEVYHDARALFEEDETALIVWTAAVINTWNRVVLAARTEPGTYQPAARR